MAKKKKSLGDMVKQMHRDLVSDSGLQNYIPDIVTFCESKEYLNLEEQGIAPYPVQKLILKVFYRGSKGNEHITLTKEEIQLCHDIGLVGKERGSIIDKFDSGEIFRELVLVWGRRCVSENTRIINAISGDVEEIGNIWDNAIKETDTYSMDENNYQFITANNSEIIYNGIKPVYKLLLSDGRSIEATDNHPFLTINGWKLLGDLKKGDRIAAPSSIDIFGNDDSLTKEEASLVGYMTGDGCSRGGRACFTSSNSVTLEDFASCLSTIGNDIHIKNDIHTQAESKQYKYVITQKKGKTKKNVLRSLLKECGIIDCLAHNKFVPKQIYKSPKNVISSYLKSLFSCDGSLYKTWFPRDNKFRYGITYTTVSEQLAYGVHHLLLRFGIISRLRKRENIKSNFKSCGWSYQIDISDRDNIVKYLHNIGFVGKDELVKETIDAFSNNESLEDISGNSYADSIPKEIWEHIDKIKNDKNMMDKDLLKFYENKNIRCHRQYSPNRYKIKQINKVLSDNFISNVLSDSIIWIDIKSISYIGEKRTFDISVQKNDCHNFVANDIICHNSGKDYMSGIMISYEAMRLLECPGGDPYKVYKISPSNPISLLTIATAAPQAGIAFQEIKSKIINSKYFKDKLAFEGIESTKISLLTPSDKIKNKELIEAGLPPTKGSIVIEVGHSNSDSLLGKQCFVLLLDEVASYKQTGGSSSGERIHSALTPSLNTFVRKIKKLDENGNQEFDHDGAPLFYRVLDSKLICISSPRGEEGLFYRLYKEAHLQDDRLMCKLPTWLVNTNLPEQFLREKNKSMTAEDFMMEYGSEFSGTGGESMFVREKVLECFKADMVHKEMGQTGNVYFAHLDPATTSHNYALVIIHRENFFDRINKVADFRVVVDHIKFWHPTPGSPIKIDEVDDYVIGLKKRFYLGMVTYDVWNSIQSIEKLKKQGIPAKCTHYSSLYKMAIYNQLEVIINAGKLCIPRHKLLKDELLHLQRKYTVKGFRVQPPKEGDIRTDDLCLVGDTILYTQNGPKMIKDIEIGDNVVCMNGSYDIVDNIISHQTDKDIYTISPFYSFSITATENHPIEIYKNNERSFVAVKDISIGDMIVKPFNLSQNDFVIDSKKYIRIDVKKHSSIIGKNGENKHLIEKEENNTEYVRDNNGNSKWHKRFILSNYDFGYFAGVYIAEGSIHDHGISFGINKNEFDFKEKIANCMSSVFGIDYCGETHQKDSNGMQLSYNSQLIKKMVCDIFGRKKAIDKTIPYIFMESNIDFQKGLIAGMYDGDGTKAAKTVSKNITFTTSSEKLAHQIQSILLRLKIISSISISKRKGNKCVFKNRKDSFCGSDLYNIRVCDFDSYVSICDILNIKMNKTRSKFHPATKYFWGDGFVACKIKYIKKEDYSGIKVYNISTKNTHTYLANGISVHNCDALAGAVYSSMNVIAHKLPGGKLVNMEQSRGGTGNQVWRSMQGVPYGTGSGAQVSHAMETRQPNKRGGGNIPPSIFNP